MRSNELCICPDNGAARAKALVVNGVVVGLFKEEDVRTRIDNDMVKVEGDSGIWATPGCLRSVDMRNNPRTVKIPPLSGQQNKATHIPVNI